MIGLTNAGSVQGLGPGDVARPRREAGASPGGPAVTYMDDQDQWPGDLDDDGDPDADQLPCPSCGAMVYDDTDRCPHCGDWIMPMAASARSRSGIWIVAAILAIIGMLVWVLT